MKKLSTNSRYKPCICFALVKLNAIEKQFSINCNARSWTNKIARELLLDYNSGANKTHITQKAWSAVCGRAMHIALCTYHMQIAIQKEKKKQKKKRKEKTDRY